MKRVIFFLSVLLLAQCAFAQFDGAVGTVGCKAVSLNSTNIKAWAKGVQVKRGYTDTSYTTHVSYGKSYMAQGRPDNTTTRAISLGYGGEALVSFDRPIRNGAGADFAVFENAFDPSFLELAFVEVSSDGVNFFRFPSTSNATSASDMQASKINNLAGKYEVGYGVPFNLDDIADNALLDKMNVRFVKLIDVNGVSDTDSHGNIIYDALSGATGYSAGFDLTGVAVLNGGAPYLIADFAGLLSSANTYEKTTTTNGTDDGTGTFRHNFVSNGVSFGGLALYSGTMWCGFAVSNFSSVPSNPADAQFVSASQSGVEGIDSAYGVSYYSDYAGTVEHNIIKMNDSSMFSPLGTYVNNAYNTYEYIKSSAFPANGYLTMVAFAYDSLGALKDSAFFSLANANHTDTVTGVVSQWQWFDLSAFGSCSKVKIILRSNDISQWGMNIPSYFCIDGFTIASVQPEYITSSVLVDSISDILANSAKFKAAFVQGSDSIIANGFSYKASLGNNWTKIAMSSVYSPFTFSATGLSANTDYSLKAWIVLAGGDTVFSTIKTFTTLQEGALADAENTSGLSVSIYPNPATSVVNLTISTGENNFVVTIFDMQGRQVNVFDLQAHNGFASQVINVSALSKGVYYLRIQSVKINKTEKLIVK